MPLDGLAENTQDTANAKTDAEKLIRQRSHQNDGEISLADFQRDAADEATHKRKKREHALDTNVDFAAFNVELRDYLAEKRREIRTEVDAINAVINALQDDDGNHKDMIEDLRAVKDQLKTNKAKIKKSEDQRTRASTVEDLQNIYTNAQAQAQNARQTAANWRASYRAYWANPAAYMAPRPGQANANAHPAGNNNNAHPQQRADQQKAIVKAHLMALSRQTDPHAIAGGFEFLKDTFGENLVIDSLIELKQDTGEHKYDVMLSSFRNMINNRQNRPAP